MESEYRISIYDIMKIPVPSGRTSEDGSPAGDTIRKMIEEHWDTHEKIVVSFDGVAKMTRSFIDEVFAKLLEKHNLEEFNQKMFFPDANDTIVRDLNQALKLRMAIMRAKREREGEQL